MYSSARPAVALETEMGGDRVLRVALDEARIAWGLLALQLALGVVLGLFVGGVEIPVFREVLAFLYLAIVPGFLVLRLAGIEPDSFLELGLYTVGVSMVVEMGLGVLVNFALRAVGVATPLYLIPLAVSFLGTTIFLTALYYRTVQEDVRVSIRFADVVSPLGLGLALLPFLGIYGGLLLTVFSNNILLLILYGVIGIIPVLALTGRIPERAYPAVIWGIALALLLQNALTGNYLAWGDQPTEAGLALIVLGKGFWDPSLAAPFGSKFTMLRIVILHPIYMVFTGFEAVWVFKLVHPVLFSITPVVLYRAYHRHVANDTAFLSAFLYMSVFSFFIVLSRNTRTASAILFLALLALVVSDRSIGSVQRMGLAILFGSGIIVSHYGVSYIVMAALPLVFVGTLLLNRLSHGRPTQTIVSGPFVLLYTVTTFTWYIYASPGAKAFSLVVGFGRTFITKLQEQFISPESSASTRYIASNWSSITLEAIKYYNVLIGAFIGLGLLFVLYRFYRDRDTEFDTEFLAYAVVFLGVFGITFLPVERFNTARTYPTSLIFFAPFFIIGVREVATRGASWMQSRDVSRTDVRRVASVIIIGYFVLNVGLISATVTHEYSTNALVEKDRIMTGGQPAENAYFYKQYPMVYEGASTEWLQVHVTNATVFESGWPGNSGTPHGYQRRHGGNIDANITRQPIPRDGTVGEGFVFLGPFSTFGNVVNFPSGHFDFKYGKTDEIAHKWRAKDRIYDNGGSVLYH